MHKDQLRVGTALLAASLTLLPGAVLTEQPGAALVEESGAAVTEEPGAGVTEESGAAVIEEPGAAVTDEPGAAPAGDDQRLALGREIFQERAEPSCTVCHTLADAGAEGEIGPDLDSLHPDYDRVMLAVTEGIGPMRPYEDLDEQELDALAYYVSTVAAN